MVVKHSVVISSIQNCGADSLIYMTDRRRLNIASH
jgi:hypothetical protein